MSCIRDWLNPEGLQYGRTGIKTSIIIYEEWEQKVWHAHSLGEG